MPEPAFAQPESSSFVKPILIALVVLGVGWGAVQYLSPKSTIEAAHLNTAVLPTHTVYKSQTIVLGPEHSEDVLFVVSNVFLNNRLPAPVTLDDFSVTLTNAEGAELTEKAVTKQDLPAIETSFPALKPMVETPLLRELTLAPRQTTQGTLVFSLQGIPQSMWDARKSAVLHVTVYHQPPIDILIPKS